MSKSHLLVIDDDPDLCELISDALEDYEIDTINDPTLAVDRVEETNPSMVLLDVNLPKGNGFELCSQIGKLMDPPLVVLISGDSSLDLRLEAYNCGGTDFIAKPFSIQELRAKIDRLIDFKAKQDALKQSSDFASKTAMNAMVEASQYGEVLRFYNDMYKANSLEQIGNCFFSLMGSFNLSASIQFRLKETKTLCECGMECSPIELQIYENLAESDRLIAFSSRMMVNGTFASMIIKNMPIDDEVSNGRLKDILATLIEGLDAKLLDLQRLKLLKQTSRELASSSERLAALMKGHEEFITGAMNHVISEINSSFHILEMTEEQETFFTQLTEQVLNSMEQSFVSVGNETDVIDCLRLGLAAMLNDRPETS